MRPRSLPAMLLASLLALSVACSAPDGANTTPPAVLANPDSVARALYAQGATWPDFTEAIRARKAGWATIIGRAEVDAALVERARAVGGEWRVVAVAIDRCGDSMNSVPYVAALADSVPGLALRIVPPSDGRPLQELYRSLDGRRATPTFVLLDAEGRTAGCVVELPRELRAWSHAARERGESSDDRHDYQRTWYEENRGRGITTEFVELLEAAQAGTPTCVHGAAPN